MACIPHAIFLVPVCRQLFTRASVPLPFFILFLLLLLFIQLLHIFMGVVHVYTSFRPCYFNQDPGRHARILDFQTDLLS